jgi:hypothetical protein
MAEKLMKKVSQNRHRPVLRQQKEDGSEREGEDKKHKDEAEESPRESCLGWWGSRRKRDGKAHDKFDWNDLCCLRHGERFEPIREDQPETEFDKDVAMLELHSVLRRHSVEPREALVNDILEWQVRSAERTLNAKPPTVEEEDERNVSFNSCTSQPS